MLNYSKFNITSSEGFMYMKIITLTFVLSSTILMAQNTTEDLSATPVVPNLSPSVIEMPVIDERIDTREGVLPDTEESQSIGQQHSHVDLEKVNGVLRKKVKISKTSTITKLDKESRKVKDLEPAGLTGF